MTRPIMTRAELAEHHVSREGRNYDLASDGWEDMEVAERASWRPIANWGRDGWDLGEWPYVSIHLREIGYGSLDAEGKPKRIHKRIYELQQVVEGDHDLYHFDAEEDRQAAVDYLFLWYAAGKRWAPLTEADRARLDAGELVVDEKFRGPCAL